MSDMSTPVPTEAELDAEVGQLTSQLNLPNSNLANAPKTNDPFALQAWNVGQLTAAGNLTTPTMVDVQARAKLLFPSYDTLTPAQQQMALEYANVHLLLEGNKARISGDPLAPGTGGQPNILLDDEIRKTYGYEAWMLNDPELRVVVEQAVAGGWDQNRIQGALEATQWWRTHSAAQQNFAQLQANSPAELDFTRGGSQASQMFTQVQDAATAAGATGIATDRLQAIAMDAIRNKWNDQQIRVALGNEVQYTGANTNAGALANQVKATAGDYFQNLSDPTIQQYSQQIMAGSQTLDTVKAQMAAQAKSRYSWLAPQIDQGLTMAQIVDPFKSGAAQLMEVTPAEINFQTDPTYQKILDYVAPGDTVHRMMTQSEMDTYLRGTTAWGNTQQARNLAAQTAASILTKWGKVA